MPRSVSLIDYKVNQADFYLQRLDEVCYDFFAAQCFCDAFTSACRSVTFAVQSVCKSIEGFEEWYAIEQNRMKNDPLLRFFHNYRTVSNHVGQTPVLAGFTDPNRKGAIKLSFMPTEGLLNPPDLDVQSACSECFDKTLDLVFRLYEQFPTDLDDRWHYTEDNFADLGLTIEDAEEAFGLPRGWTQIEGTAEELTNRWSLLRITHTLGPEIQEVFSRRLDKTISGPD